jgi:toxin ParE1/3/4
MIVVITAAAKADLIAIAEYIGQENPDRAATFTEGLLDCCNSLVELHSAFPLVPRYEALAIRRRVHGRYLIFYRVSPNRIDVLHILHGARDYDTFLFGAFGSD